MRILNMLNNKDIIDLLDKVEQEVSYIESKLLGSKQYSGVINSKTTEIKNLTKEESNLYRILELVRETKRIFENKLDK